MAGVQPVATVLLPVGTVLPVPLRTSTLSVKAGSIRLTIQILATLSTWLLTNGLLLDLTLDWSTDNGNTWTPWILANGMPPQADRTGSGLPSLVVEFPPIPQDLLVSVTLSANTTVVMGVSVLVE